MSIEKKWSRSHPFPSRILNRSLLSKKGSTKETYHLSLSLKGSSLVYHPGDSIAVLPTNDPADVHAVLDALHLSGHEEIVHPIDRHILPLSTYLTEHANLQKSPPSLLRSINERLPNGEITELFSSENKTRLAHFLDTNRPFDLFSRYPITLSAQELTQFFLPMLPRFYSIASSQLVYPEEAHLTVALVSQMINGEMRYGVASRFLCQRALTQQTPIPIYIQPAHGFSLPSDQNAPIILVGTGTGIAPFRAFLQERMTIHSPGKNWLFFGERNRAHDFYYEDFWFELQKQGFLRLDLAFSRDHAQKRYVQHLMWEQKKDLWDWIQQGAFFYVCGNAKEMAKAVEEILNQIIIEEGKLSEQEAKQFFSRMRAEKRYLTDVY